MKHNSIRNFIVQILQNTMYLKTTCACIGTILLLAACQNELQHGSDGMPPLYPAPKSIVMNTEEGFVINPVTGDTIQPILNSMGVPVVTGVPVPFTGRIIDPESVKKPEEMPAGELLTVSTGQNAYQIKEPLPSYPVDKSAQNTFTPGLDSSSSVLINSTGDTVTTGVAMAISGRSVPCSHPRPVQAMPLQMKDNSSINIKYLDVEQGMNSSHILSIMEDNHGNLWFGTGAGGASMYNGVSFTHFTENEGLSNNIVWSALEDSRGNLWFGTYGGGVCMYDGKCFIHYTEREGLSDNRIRTILEDSRGDLWFGTFNGGVIRYTNDTATHFSEKEGLCSNKVRSILEDSHGNLWFGTYGGGACMFDGKVFTYYTENEGLSNNYVLTLTEDSQGRIWFGTEGGGANMYDGEAFMHLTEKEGLSSNYVNAIFEDSRGNLWFGTEYGGVNMYDGKSLTYITEDEGLSNNNINTIFEDSKGNLWFGTEYGGVSMYKDGFFKHFTGLQSSGDQRIRSILEDHNGNLWMGMWNGGVVRYNGRTIAHFAENKGINNYHVLSIIEDSRGDLWFGTEHGGAVRYNGKTFMPITDKEGLSNNIVRSILEDSKGNLWFGTYRGGVVRYDGTTFTHFTEKEGLSNNYVVAILEDSRGNLWFGTYGGGVSLYNGKTITHFTEKEGLSSNVVWSLMEDSKGNIWFGTYGGGAMRYNGETITYYTEKEGLSNNIVQSVLEDHHSNIWISTEKGLSLLVSDPYGPNSRYHNPAIHTYGMQDGLKAMDFILNTALLDSKNRIWWGNSKSLIMLNMNDFKIPALPAEIRLCRIEINEKYIDYRQSNENDRKEMEFSGVAQFYNYPLDLELPFKNNNLTFHFSAIDWSAQEKVRYSYKMEGLKGNWSNPTPEPKAVYRSLPFGTYTFKVRAIGEAQIWSAPFMYTFTINPPWWLSWWMRIAYFLTALLIIYGFVRLRTVKIKERQKELESEVARAISLVSEQKEEIETQRDEVVKTNKALEDQKRELELTLNNLKMTQSQLIQSEKMASVGVLTAGIAHELNNPINFISGNVNPLSRDLEELFSLIEKYEETIKKHNLADSFRETDDLKKKMDYNFLIKEIVSLLEGIGEGAKRSGQIVKGLRSFSRLDEEKIQFYNIHEGIDSTLTLLHNKIKNKITVRKIYGDFEGLECYPGKLNQVFMNIITNSIQAMGDKGELIIQTISSGIGVKIIIKDNGKGMTPEVKKHIFEPFFTTKEVGKGTGLGLSISYGIIEQHKGNIDVISAPGKGTEFIISLPHKQTE